MSDTPHDSSAIGRLLARTQASLERVNVDDLPAAREAGAWLIDIRPVAQRERDGELPGATVIDRNVLEWRLDPTSPYRLPEADDPDRWVIVVCDAGFSSSLAAAGLRDLGLRRATDLVGGFQALLAIDSEDDR